MSPMNESENNTPSNPATARSPDLENQSLSYAPMAVQQRRKEDFQVVLRVLGFVSSIISFAVMASNKHGLTTDGLLNYSNNFYDYDVYRYLLAVGVVSTVYCKAQLLRLFCNGKPMFTQRGLMLLDFYGDQVIAYLLLSGGSSAIQTTRDLRSSGVMLHSFTDSSAASISMAFVAFVALALSAIISAFKLCP